MPVVLHTEPDELKQETNKKDIYEDGSSRAENLLVRIGTGTMTGIAGFLITL